jgi:hypothetical protein
MFWKVLGGIVAFFLVVALAVMLLATAGVAAFGVAVGSFVDNLDISTVQVTDASGNTETYDVDDLISESGRVEVTGDNGEQVTIDLNVPQITVQESGDDAPRVVIGGGSRLEVKSDVPQIRIDGRNFDNFDGSFFVRPIASFFHGLFKLAAWTLIAVGIWLVLRNRQPSANEPKEKTPSATA